MAEFARGIESDEATVSCQRSKQKVGVHQHCASFAAPNWNTDIKVATIEAMSNSPAVAKLLLGEDRGASDPNAVVFPTVELTFDGPMTIEDVVACVLFVEAVNREGGGPELVIVHPEGVKLGEAVPLLDWAADMVHPRLKYTDPDGNN